MKNLISLLSLLIICSIGKAQQMPAYSQYFDNLFLLNPAVAGGSGYTVINVMAREQWVGIEGAPKAHSVSLQGRILKSRFKLRPKLLKEEKIYMSKSKGKVGIGGYIYNDRNGLIDRTGGCFAYAYHIKYRKSQISFGLSMTMFQFRLIRNDMVIVNPLDPVTSYDGIRSIYTPDANVGVYISNRNYYAGFSSTQLMQSALKLGNRAFNDYKLMRHYYMFGGYNFYLSERLVLTPSVLLKSTETIQNFQADFSCKAIWDERVFGGISFRTSKDAIIFLGLFHKQYGFGYAFDYAFSPIQNRSLGTHEFSVSMKFGSEERRYRWVDRY